MREARWPDGIPVGIPEKNKIIKLLINSKR
jgi:hypothetical protein